jgi:hypothetical protein
MGHGATYLHHQPPFFVLPPPPTTIFCIASTTNHLFFFTSTTNHLDFVYDLFYLHHQPPRACDNTHSDYEIEVYVDKRLKECTGCVSRTGGMCLLLHGTTQHHFFFTATATTKEGEAMAMYIMYIMI